MGEREQKVAEEAARRFKAGEASLNVRLGLNGHELQQNLAQKGLRIAEQKPVTVVKSDKSEVKAVQLTITDLEGNGPKPKTQPVKPPGYDSFTDLFNDLFGGLK